MYAQTLRLSILFFCLGMLSVPQGSMADTRSQHAVRQRCLALSAAVNAHELEAILAFMDSSYVREQKDGPTLNLKQYMEALTRLFQSDPNLKETLILERIVIKHGNAEVSSISTLTFRSPRGNQRTVSRHTLQTWQKIRGRWMLVKEQPLWSR